MSVLQRRNGLLILLTILLGMAVSLSYTFIVRPVSDQLTMKKMQLTEEKQLQKTLEASLQKKQAAVQSTMGLQRELPVKPLIDQYLLDLEKAEMLSGTQMLSVGISEGDANELLQSPAAVAVQQAAAQQSNAADPAAASDDGTQAQVQSAPAQNAAASGIKRIIFNLSVTARSYEDMIAFVDRIEKLKRISRVDSFAYSGGEGAEGTSAEAAAIEGIKFDVAVSTFFLDGMDGLMGELPWQEYPKPAGKKNPLPQN